MVRSLTFAVALALGTISVPAHALGLGDIETRSALNQPLNADIDLLSVANGEIDAVRVQLAPVEAFERAGVERPFFLTLLKFRPMRLENGEAVIRITSDFPIREPFLNFLVEVNWPRGRLLREYTLLLDPPVTTGRRPPQVTPVQTPVATSRPAPAATAIVAPQQVGEGQYGPIRENDTLWSIARSVRPRGVSMAQMMIALQRANPQAFIDNNINKLRKGQILRVPGTDEILAISRNEAQEAYSEQRDAWLTQRPDGPAAEPQTSPAPTEDTAQAPDTASEATADDNLRIATARPEGEGEAGAGEDRGDAETVDDIRRQLLLARENAETSRLETESLRSEMTELQNRLDDMQRLLSLKDEQLARLQESAGMQPTAETSDGAVPETAAETAPEASDAAMPEEPEVAQPEIVSATPESVLEKAADAVTEAMNDPDKTLDSLQSTPAPVAGEAVPAGVPGTSAPVAETPAPKPVEPVQPPARPQPAVTEDVQPVADQPGFLEQYWPYLVGAGGLVLLLVLLLAARRQSGKEGEELVEAEVAAETQAAATAGTATPEAEANDTSFLSEFTPSDLSALRDDTGEVDPVSEADVYIAYGRYQQARDLLDQAMQRDPDRLSLKHKLLEVYYATQDRDGYLTLAQQVVDAGQDIADPEAWTRAKEMGRELDPDNPLFEASADDVRGLDAVKPVAPAFDEDQDVLSMDDRELSELASDLGRDEGEEVPRRDQLTDDLSLELDDLITDNDELDEDSIPIEGMESLESLDLDLPDLDSEELGSALDRDSALNETSPESALSGDSDFSPDDLQAQLDELSDLSVLDADLSSMTIDLEPDLPPQQEAPGQEEVVEEDVLDRPISLDDAFDEDHEDDDIPETADISSLIDDEAGEDAVGTKLELARAYMEMGDQDGARSILEEVAGEGSQAQKDEANRLLSQIG